MSSSCSPQNGAHGQDKNMKLNNKATAAGILSAALVAGTVSPALAHGHNRGEENWSQGLGVGNAGPAGDPTQRPPRGRGHGHDEAREAAQHVDSTVEDQALRTAILAANDVYRTAVQAAKDVYTASTATAKTSRDAVLTSTTATRFDKIVARNDYAIATADAKVIRDGAIDTAYGVWTTSVDSALATYDAATTTGDVLNARGTFRVAIRAASNSFRAAMTASKVTYKNSKATARTALIAAMALATTDGEKQAALDAYSASTQTARDAFKTARDAAQDAYKTARDAARDAYTATTGLQMSKTPGLDRALKIKR